MNNVRTSKKRDAMLALLQSTHCHPGADWVYREMRTQYPGLSLGTVYRNLNHLCERGLIRRVGTVDGQERYDGMITPHSHFICNRCGAILDLPGRVLGQVYDGAAAVANKVGVGLYHPIVPLLAVYRPHPLDEAPGAQVVQVAVYGAQAQAGVLAPHPLVDPVRRGVAVGPPQQGQHRVPFFALSDVVHGSSFVDDGLALNKNDYWI